MNKIDMGTISAEEIYVAAKLACSIIRGNAVDSVVVKIDEHNLTLNFGKNSSYQKDVIDSVIAHANKRGKRNVFVSAVVL